MVEFAKPPRSMMDDRFVPHAFPPSLLALLTLLRANHSFGGPPPRGGGYGGGYGGPPPRSFDRPPPPRAGSGFRITIQGLREGTSWQVRSLSLSFRAAARPGGRALRTKARP